MSSHWPIIAAIIAILNQWAIFWFKVYWDKRATATAKPTTTQPEAVRKAKRRWVRRFVWLVNILATFVSVTTLQIAWNVRPLTGPMIAVVVACILLILSAFVLPWAVPKDSPKAVISSPVVGYVGMFGVLWDEHDNPCCPICKVIMSSSDRLSIGGYRCPNCHRGFILKDDVGQPINTLRAKRQLTERRYELGQKANLSN